MIYTTAQEMIRTLAFELSDTVQKKKKKEWEPKPVSNPRLPIILYFVIPVGT